MWAVLVGAEFDWGVDAGFDAGMEVDERMEFFELFRWRKERHLEGVHAAPRLRPATLCFVVPCLRIS